MCQTSGGKSAVLTDCLEDDLNRDQCRRYRSIHGPNSPFPDSKMLDKTDDAQDVDDHNDDDSKHLFGAMFC